MGLSEVGYSLLFSFFDRIQKTKISVVIAPSAVAIRFHTPFSFPYPTSFSHLQLELLGKTAIKANFSFQLA